MIQSVLSFVSSNMYLYTTMTTGAILGGIYLEPSRSKSRNFTDILSDTAMASLAGAGLAPFTPILLPGVIARYLNP